jgi:uncharacterized membrane protein YecN with MAPEG domain
MLLEDMLAIGLVGLSVLGVAGVAYKLFRPEGWGTSLLAYLWSKSPWLVWLAGFSIAAITLWAKHTYDRNPDGRRTGNFATYFLIVLGLFFLFRLMVTGRL